MKESPRLAQGVLFLSFILLCMSLTYWGLQTFKPQPRAVADVGQTARAAAGLDAAASLFGGRAANVALVSNYQLKGVVMASNPIDSAAIIAVDGKPAQSWIVGQELQPGVLVKEVRANYIVLSEGGLTKRLELPESVKSVSGAGTPPVGINQGMPPNGLPQVMPNQNNPGIQPAPVAPPVPPTPAAPNPMNGG